MFGCSCTSSEENHLKILMNEMGLEFVNPSDSNYVIVIPGNGCGSCIQDAIAEIEEYDDTAYVFVCDSEKISTSNLEGRRPLHSRICIWTKENYSSIENDSNLSQCLPIG